MNQGLQRHRSRQSRSKKDEVLQCWANAFGLELAPAILVHGPRFEREEHGGKQRRTPRQHDDDLAFSRVALEGLHVPGTRDALRRRTLHGSNAGVFAGGAADALRL
jgi:hypothetical protein